MATEPQVMQCMEVWGGNQFVDASVSMPGLDAWVYSRPFHDDTDGGDVHFVSSCATGRITRLLLADVSGHGISVGGIAAQLRTLMRKFVNRIEQRTFVESMNERFTELTEAGNFATAIVTTFFAPTNRLTLFNAGHPAPLIYRVKARSWSLLDAYDEHGRRTNLPLGIETESPGKEELGIDLEIGDLVLCYTDALIETRNAAGELIGEQGLLGVVRNLEISEPTRLIADLLDTLAKMQPDSSPADDITILLFRPNGQAPRVPLKDRILAPFRVLKGVGTSLLQRTPLPLPEFTPTNIGGAMFSMFNRPKREKRS